MGILVISYLMVCAIILGSAAVLPFFKARRDLVREKARLEALRRFYRGHPPRGHAPRRYYR